ncbi:MAG: DUF4131 domain-containing protein, partial [Dehalococcoidia bacterium]
MPLVWPALGLILGLFLSTSWEVPWEAALLLLVAAAGALALNQVAGTRAAPAVLLIAGALLGLLRGGPDLPEQAQDLQRSHGSTVELKGEVSGLPELVGSQVRFRLEADGIRADEGDFAPTAGAVVVWA